jgi:predicted kinase
MLSGYLEATGDYAGVALLRYYAVYRALVRARVALLRTQQPAAPPIARVRAQATFAHYLALAESLSQSQARPLLVVMTGLSGSGKSTVAIELAAQLGALRVRSDVERKRLAGLTAVARGGSDLYAPGMTARTYAQLQKIAAGLLDAGVSVVVDAASLRSDERRDLARVAQARGCGVSVVGCEAPAAVLAARVAARERSGRDPSDATRDVLALQHAWREPRASDEPVHEAIDTDCPPGELRARCAALAERLRSA